MVAGAGRRGRQPPGHPGRRVTAERRAAQVSPPTGGQDRARPGGQAPAWYTELKASAVPLLGNPAAMAAAARAIGLACARAEERPVDVGITQPHQLVTYRLGHPIFAAWLDALGPSRARAFAAEAERAIREGMQPYRPVV